MNGFNNVYEKYDLINNNTYKVHSICNYYVVINKITELINLIKYLNDNNIKYFIIGEGSNIILPSKYNGVVIKLNMNECIIKKNIITVSANYKIIDIINICKKQNLGGLEKFYGIPGSIGGMTINNSGAFDDFIWNYIEEITVLENNKIRILKKNEIEYDYRYTSLIKRDLVIINVTLKLIKLNEKIIDKNILDILNKRINVKYPSAGSVFKNGKDFFIGKLIDEANLKNYHINDAYISDIHANFIINKGSACGEDIIKLIKYIEISIKDIYNIDIELEQRIII